MLRINWKPKFFRLSCIPHLSEVDPFDKLRTVSWKKAEWSMNRWKLLCNSLLELHCSCLNNNVVEFENSAVKSRVDDLLEWMNIKL